MLYMEILISLLLGSTTDKESFSIKETVGNILINLEKIDPASSSFNEFQINSLTTSRT